MLLQLLKYRFSVILFVGMIITALQPAQAQFYELGLPKQSFNTNEQVVVSYSSFGGFQQDWITIVPTGTPANSYKQWFYTGGKTNGTMTFKGLPAGSYEVRAYANWPIGKYHVRNSVQFKVGGNASHTSGHSSSLNGFSGVWSTSYGDMHLTQVGNRVYGYYGSKSSGKTIEGEMVGDKLIGRWGRTNSSNWGQVEFVLNSNDSSFDGSWRYGNKGAWKGWDGDRK